MHCAEGGKVLAFDTRKEAQQYIKQLKERTDGNR
jgi:hypothetical protein